MPSVAIVGGYVNQQAQDYVQPNVGFVGAVATYTFVDSSVENLRNPGAHAEHGHQGFQPRV